MCCGNQAFEQKQLKFEKDLTPVHFRKAQRRVTRMRGHHEADQEDQN